MTNVDISWDVPPIATLGNITNFTVLRGKVTNASIPQTCATLQAAAAADPIVGSVNGDVDCVLKDTSKLATNHTDENVAAGTYMYGVYAVNNAGANACLSTSVSQIEVA